MNTRFKVLAVAVSVLASGVLSSSAVSFNFANTPGAKIQFDGLSHFNFNPEGATAKDLKITSGSASGLFGDISGTFSIGTITTVAGVSTAPISGSGTFKIYDGANTLTANLTWDKMFQFGTGDTLNIDGIVNMTTISYSGSNADLLALKNDGSAINVVTFQFVPAKSLAYLKSHSINTSFSGSVTSVPVPDGGTTALLLGLSFLGAGFAGVRRNR